MNKIILTPLMVLLFIGSCYSQGKEQSIVEKHSRTYIGLGGVISSFQDVKFSNLRYSGIGTRFDFGIEKRKQSIYGLDFSFIYSKEKVKTFDHGKAHIFNGILGIKYLMPLMENETHKFYLGGKWDILDFYVRAVQNLNNNSINYINGSNLKVSVLYERKLSDNLTLNTSMDLQLISFMKELTSFGFSAPQDPLEDGEFGYQNEPLESPFGFKYFSLEAPWNYFNIGTQINLHYKKRWNFAYKWNMQRSNEVKGYPLTRGYNSLSIIYNIQNK